MRNNIFAFVNQKGGVGKTATTHNISAAMAMQGKKVLMIDLDPESNLTMCCGYDPLSSFDCTVVDLFQNKKLSPFEAIYEVEEVPGLSLIPANPDFAVVEKNLTGEYKLKKIIEPLMDTYDYIMIDCPPQLSLLTINAFTAADNVVIPCQTHILSYNAMSRSLKDSIDGMREERNPDIHVVGVIATIYNCLEIGDQEVLESLRRETVYPLLGVVKRAAAIKKDIKKGLSTVIREPRSKVAQSYINIAEKIMKEHEA